MTWLGRETHITGEVFRTANGLAIAARGGGDGGAMVTGSEANLDKLLQQTAEAIYKRTQPYRYAIYAESHGKIAEASAILQHLTVEGGIAARSRLGVSRRRCTQAILTAIGMATRTTSARRSLWFRISRSPMATSKTITPRSAMTRPRWRPGKSPCAFCRAIAISI